MELKGKKVLILVEQMFNDQEFWYPYYRLKEAGGEVTVVGSGSADAYTGKSGTIAEVDANAGEISALLTPAETIKIVKGSVIKDPMIKGDSRLTISFLLVNVVIGIICSCVMILRIKKIKIIISVVVS